MYSDSDTEFIKIVMLGESLTEKIAFPPTSKI